MANTHFLPKLNALVTMVKTTDFLSSEEVVARKVVLKKKEYEVVPRAIRMMLSQITINTIKRNGKQSFMPPWVKAMNQICRFCVNQRDLREIIFLQISRKNIFPQISQMYTELHFFVPVVCIDIACCDRREKGDSGIG